MKKSGLLNADLLHVIASMGHTDRLVVAEEMRQRSPAIYQATRQMLGGLRLEHVPHEAFKALLPGVRAVVRTGEQTPYANVILQSGVPF